MADEMLVFEQGYPLKNTAYATFFHEQGLSVHVGDNVLVGGEIRGVIKILDVECSAYGGNTIYIRVLTESLS